MRILEKQTLKDAPGGYITSIQHSPLMDLMLATSIYGELIIYDIASVGDAEMMGPILSINLGKPILTSQFYENFIIVGYPDSVEMFEIMANYEVEIKSIKSILVETTLQSVKVGHDLNVMIVATCAGQISMYNLPDLVLLDSLKLNECKIQTFDCYHNYVVVATNKRAHIIDISSKMFYELKEVESGFMYPVTMDLKIVHTSSSNFSELPHDLMFVQAGLEGKVSVVTARIESQTEPTVTINTAARNAPISNSCTNPSGIIISQDESRYIFRAHKTTLNDGTISIGPIYSLSVVNDLVLTSGYGGDQKNQTSCSLDGSICFWDIGSKKRVKMYKGFPQSVVVTDTWVTNGGKRIVVCGCSDDSFKNMSLDMAASHTPRASVLEVLVFDI